MGASVMDKSGEGGLIGWIGVGGMVPSGRVLGGAVGQKAGGLSAAPTENVERLRHDHFGVGGGIVARQTRHELQGRVE